MGTNCTDILTVPNNVHILACEIFYCSMGIAHEAVLAFEIYKEYCYNNTCTCSTCLNNEPVYLHPIYIQDTSFFSFFFFFLDRARALFYTLFCLNIEMQMQLDICAFYRYATLGIPSTCMLWKCEAVKREPCLFFALAAMHFWLFYNANIAFLLLFFYFQIVVSRTLRKLLHFSSEQSKHLMPA